MLFNSIDFAIFLPIVFSLYWFATNKNIKLQNLILVVSSYVFYGLWDWRFLSLILFSTCIDFSVGIKLGVVQNENHRKILLWTSIIINLGFLGFFKYYNFFIENLANTFTFLGSEITANSLNIILPVGISFYTFQTLSYTIDIYKRKLEPTKDFLAFCTFISFFPQLVAGPIERATNLLPQFFTNRIFDYPNAVDGMRQILWGLFKKIVIADSCATHANLIFNSSSDYSGSTLALGAVFFAFQIYGDFSGYSDIAIGTSRLFGFNLLKNFAFPYFSRDIAEFWRRWHISLSTWFRDYLYIPLGGSHGSTISKIRNTFIIFIVSGFWHGANWTFIVWGALNAIFFLPLLLTNRNRSNLQVVGAGGHLPSAKEAFNILITFSLTIIAWIFFRADNMTHALQILSGIFSKSFLTIPQILPKTTFLLISVFLFIEWMGRENEYAIEKIAFTYPRFIRWSFYLSICFSILIFQGKQQEFIYFQF